MTAKPQALFPPAASIVPIGGVPVVAAYGPLLGGFLQNPIKAQDQDIAIAEVLYVDLINPAALEENDTTQALQPGQTFNIPANFTGNVSVNAATSGHRFSAVVIQTTPPFPPTPQTGVFPPAGPTSLTKVIPSYLYQQYKADAACQAFVDAYNAFAQGYVDWFNQTPLPVYTNPAIAGALLDWVALGLYGIARPALSSGRRRVIGPYNTWAPNTLPLNVQRILGPTDVVVTSDDIFKRILTWNLYRGDGITFNIRWLKRRIMRFLIGVNGTAPNVDNTSPISVTIGPGIISIQISQGTRKIVGGALYNRFMFNGMPLNRLITQFVPGPSPLPNENVLKEAIDSGVLQLPFQYEYVVSTGGN